MKIIGVLIILATSLFSLFWISTDRPNTKWFFWGWMAMLLVGLVFIFHENITEITINNIGTIKTQVKQAASDAEEISKIKKMVEAQSKTIFLVADAANDTKNRVEEVSERNEKADKKLGLLDESIARSKRTLGRLGNFATFYQYSRFSKK